MTIFIFQPIRVKARTVKVLMEVSSPSALKAAEARGKFVLQFFRACTVAAPGPIQ